MMEPAGGFWILLTGISDQCKLTVESISLEGVWFWHGSEVSEQYNQYFIAGDNGVFKDFGAFCFESGTYELLPGSSFILTIIEPVQYCDGKTHVAKGQLTSFIEGSTIFNDEIRNMEKISDLSICEGTWNGTLVENNILHTEYDITIIVDSEGVITSYNGDFTPPVSGRMFGKSNDIVAFLRTGEPYIESVGYNEMKINATMIGSSITGKYINDMVVEGTINLTKIE